MDADSLSSCSSPALLQLQLLDAPSGSALHVRAMEIAGQCRLTAAYDAHYLALAEREACECWTADQQLWNAVKSPLPWVRWLGELSAAPTP